MRPFISFCLMLCFLLPSCSNGLETVETKDDYGYTIKYTRSKKDYAKQGVYVKYYPNGNKYEEATYVNNVLNGERKIYYENGKVEIIEQYQDGVFNGPFQQYHENGKLKQEGIYVDNVTTGDWKSYYESGQLKEVVTMKNNEENGPFVEYHENGNKKAEGTYLDGDNEDGPLLIYDQSGELIKKMDCQKGICRTTWDKEKSADQ